MLACLRVRAGENRNFFCLHRLLDVHRLRCAARPLSIGGGDDLSIGPHKLQLQRVFLFKGLRIGNTGLIVVVIALADIIAEKVRGCLCLGHKAGLHAGVVIVGNRQRHDHNCRADQREHHTDGIKKPPLLDTGHLFHTGVFLLSSALKSEPYAPHLYPNPHTVVI